MGYIRTTSGNARNGKKNWYHRAYYKDEFGNETYTAFRCRKSDPKKCNGKYGSEHYCQAYRDAEKELRDREVNDSTATHKYDALPEEKKIQLLELLKVSEETGVGLGKLMVEAEAKSENREKIKLNEARKIYFKKLAQDTAATGSNANEKKSKSIVNPFVDHFGNKREMHTLTIPEIREWAESKTQWSNQYKNRAFKNLVTFWNYFKNQNYLLPDKNPFSPADPKMQKPGLQYFKVVTKGKDFLSLSDARNVLKNALSCTYTAAVTILVMLCGLRVEEACKLTWDDIDLGEDSDEPDIYISPNVAKKHRAKSDGRVDTAERTIPLSPMQVEWLRAAKEAGAFLPVHIDTFYTYKTGKHPSRTAKGVGANVTRCGNTAFRGGVKAVMPETKNRQNVLRHTYVTYHLAYFEDIGQVSKHAGNKPDMIREHYANQNCKKSVAKKYWELLP